MSDLWVTIAGGLTGVAVGFLLSFVGTCLRDKLQAAADRRLLAGALAAELRGFRELCPEQEGAVKDWAAEQSYTPIYDSAGPRLLLLAHDVAEEVVKCYFKVKRALDELNRAQLMTRDWQLHEYLWPGKLNKDGRRHATEAREAAVATSQNAASAIDVLLPKLHRLVGREKSSGSQPRADHAANLQGKG